MEIEAFREALANAPLIPEISEEWENDLLARVEDSIDRATPLPQLPRVPTWRERERARVRAQVASAAEPEKLARKRPRTDKTRRVIDAATKSDDFDPVEACLERDAARERTFRQEVVLLHRERGREARAKREALQYAASPEAELSRMRHAAILVLAESRRHYWQGLEPLCGADVARAEPWRGKFTPGPVDGFCEDCMVLVTPSGPRGERVPDLAPPGAWYGEGYRPAPGSLAPRTVLGGGDR